MYVCMYVLLNVHLGHPHITICYHLRQAEHYVIQKSDGLILHLILRANDTLISHFSYLFFHFGGTLFYILCSDFKVVLKLIV